MSDLNGYISTLHAEDRALAREYGEMPAPEFQARMGPAVDKIIETVDGFGERLEALSPNGKSRLNRIASISVGDAAKYIGISILTLAGIAIKQAT